jgi:signal transduction histidine kinase
VRRRKDFAAAAGAVLVIVAIGSLVLAAVVDARNAGRRRLGQVQVAQVQELARSMDTRIQQAFTSFQGVLTVPYHATMRNRSDAKRLDQLQALNPKATTGIVLVNRRGVVVNGTLLRDSSVLGTRLERKGLAGVLAGKPAVLTVAPGLTTALPTIALAYPLHNRSGGLKGAFIAEEEVSATSQFNEEVAPLAGTNHATFSFIDNTGSVVASNDVRLIGRKLNDPLVGSRTGLIRGGGNVAVVEAVPAAGWRAVFTQPSRNFEGSLTGPLRSALVYLALLTIAIAGLVAVILLRRLARSREEQRRLNQLGTDREEFISIVSHELRTPVVGLLGFLQTTLDHWEGMDDGARRQSVARAWANASRLYLLSRDVLDSSSLETGHLTYHRDLIDLREVVGATVAAAREMSGARQIELEIGNEPLWVNGDPERLQQVVHNLLDNAATASPPDAPIEVASLRRGQRVIVTVHDHGPGLSAEDRERVFEKFVRGRGAHTIGTGLGLYISQQIVHAHDGAISADNAPEGGAVFTLDLPLVGQPAGVGG